MVLAILIILGFLAAFVLLRKVEIEKYSPSSKFLVPFYKLSVPIVDSILKQKKGILKDSFLKPQVVERLKQINPTDRTYLHIKKYYAEKLALSFFIILSGSILTILAILGQSKEGVIIEDKYIERSSYTEGEKSHKLKVSVGDETVEQDINFTVNGQQLTQEEVFQIFKQVENQIDEQIKGNNTSLMEVRSDLKLPSKIENQPIKISWETDNFEVLGADGEIDNKKVPDEGVLVTLTATLRYQDYLESYDIKVKVMPPIYSDAEILINTLLERMKETDQNSLTNQYFELPLSINGKSIIWSESKSNVGGLLLFLGVFGAIIIYYGKDKDLETRVKKREQQLLSDYPDIVSKLTLLLGAGMTVKGAWQKVALDYREKKQADKLYYRYAYEEMLISYYEIMSGVSEASAYEDFGKRTKNQRYMKLTSLITQNLKKGSKGLSKILETESLDAFEDRKAFAKTAGEEAGTKLMMPMFLNLIVVLVIIMIPACMSFQM